MLETLSSKVIIPKVKAMYGSSITDADYEQLLHRTSVSDCAAYLKSRTHYRFVMRDVQESQVHRGALEALLGREAFERFCRLYHYGGTRRELFFESYAGKFEINSILNAIRFMDTSTQNEFIRLVPSYFSDFASFDVLSLGAVDSYSSLLAMLKKTRYYKPLSLASVGRDGRVSLSRVEELLYNDYYERLFSLIKKNFRGEEASELISIFSIERESHDLSSLYRIKSFFNDSESGSAVLLGILPGGGRLRKHTIKELKAAEGVDELNATLSKTSYKKYFNSGMADSVGKFGAMGNVDIELAVGKLAYDNAKRLLNFSTYPAVVFMAFMLLQNIELENLINIIEGVRYGLDIPDIRALLILEEA